MLEELKSDSRQLVDFWQHIPSIICRGLQYVCGKRVCVSESEMSLFYAVALIALGGGL